MATLLTLKRRIKTARNVSKTTKAMQMIAASKLKRAQDAAVAAAPYAQKLSELSKNISRQGDIEELTMYTKSPDTSARLTIVISPDKGLSGGLVSNLIREVLRDEARGKQFYIAIGKKAENYLNAFGKEIIAAFPFGTTLPPYDTIFPILSIIEDYFKFQKVSSVEIITTRFNSVFSQAPSKQVLLPITLEEEQVNAKDMVFEPNAKELLPDLLRHYLETALYHNLLESYASEQAARMIAMKNATDNANEIIDELTLMYNKSRQEKITAELLDIGGGMYE